MIKFQNIFQTTSDRNPTDIFPLPAEIIGEQFSICLMWSKWILFNLLSFKNSGVNIVIVWYSLSCDRFGNLLFIRIDFRFDCIAFQLWVELMLLRFDSMWIRLMSFMLHWMRKTDRITLAVASLSGTLEITMGKKCLFVANISFTMNEINLPHNPKYIPMLIAIVHWMPSVYLWTRNIKATFVLSSSSIFPSLSHSFRSIQVMSQQPNSAWFLSVWVKN